MVKAEVLTRHGKPGSSPVWQQVAVEVGDDVPSEELLAELADAARDGAKWAQENGEAVEVTLTFRPPA